MNVHVPSHPLIRDALARCRDATTETPEFRRAMSELSRYLAYECCRDWLPTRDEDVLTPLGVTASASRIDQSRPVEIVPILRAGLALVEGVLPLLPNAKILHVGYRRDEETAQATCYLTRLPDQLPKATRFLILEPMLATGGTLVQVFDAMRERGADMSGVRVISLIASEQGLKTINAHHPEPAIYCAAIDPILNEKVFIVPGLGDAGDRAFGTE